VVDAISGEVLIVVVVVVVVVLIIILLSILSILSIYYYYYYYSELRTGSVRSTVNCLQLTSFSLWQLTHMGRWTTLRSVFSPTWVGKFVNIRVTRLMVSFYFNGSVCSYNDSTRSFST